MWFSVATYEWKQIARTARVLSHKNALKSLIRGYAALKLNGDFSSYWISTAKGRITTIDSFTQGDHGHGLFVRVVNGEKAFQWCIAP